MDSDTSDEEETVTTFTEDFDQASFQQNYSKLKKKYQTRPYLTKYEKTKILSERSQQIANGSKPFIKNPESFSSVYEIAMEELKNKRIPFIIQRPFNNSFEYWKLEDLNII
jgi:DNA-directed RNA polymerase subunit K/omega